MFFFSDHASILRQIRLLGVVPNYRYFLGKVIL